MKYFKYAINLLIGRNLLTLEYSMDLLLLPLPHFDWPKGPLEDYLALNSDFQTELSLVCPYWAY